MVNSETIWALIPWRITYSFASKGDNKWRGESQLPMCMHQYSILTIIQQSQRDFQFHSTKIQQRNRLFYLTSRRLRKNISRLKRWTRIRAKSKNYLFFLLFMSTMKMLTRKVALVGSISFQEPLNKNLFVFFFREKQMHRFILNVRHSIDEKSCLLCYTPLNYDYDPRSWGVQFLNGSTRISYLAVFSNKYMVEFECAWPIETDAFLFIT